MEAAPSMTSTMDAAAPTAAYPLYPYHMVYSVPGAPAMMINAKDGAFLAMLQNPMMAAKAGAPVMVGATEDVQQQAQAPAQQPTYVNPKQYHRIMARRKARARLEAHRKTLAARKPFLHQSRHEHACRRPRGKGGRFLTKDELAALDEAKKLEEAAGGAGQQQQPPPQQQSAGGRAQGMKQAGAAGQGGHAAQVQHAWVQDDGEDDEEDEEEEESFEGGAAMKRTRVS